MAKAGKPPRLPVQQLAILATCRIAEPIALTSVFPYLPEMIESFNVPKQQVAKWAGITSASFSLSQALTGIAWGRASDRVGRKPIILAGYMGVMLAGLFFGFSQTLAWAIIARGFAGLFSGNVGITRTMVAEMVPQRELQPRAFSIMPLVWSIGSIFGPAFGGALANPATKYPRLFGASGFFKKYPFALPNMVSSILFLVGLVFGFLFLKETLETRKSRPDSGRRLGKQIIRLFAKKKTPAWQLEGGESAALLGPSHSSSFAKASDATNTRHGNVTLHAPTTYKEIFSRQSTLNLITYTLLALHGVAYDQLLPVFMHYPPQMARASNPEVKLPFKFSGGFGIDSDQIGFLFTLYGVTGMFIQFLIFPPVAKRYGVLPCLKVVTIMFPLLYVATPFTALMQTALSQQIAMFAIMVVKSFAVVFAFPCCIILLTNSAVSQRVLGTLNGVSTSISALGRAAGPAIGGWTFSVGVDSGYVIFPWWTLAAFAVLGAIPVWWLVESEGFGESEAEE